METPKEVAKRLVDKFSPHVNPYIGSGMLSNTYDDLAILHQSKQCALIAVDEILNSIKSAQFRVWHHEEMTFEFWNEVKTEIEKL